MNDQCSAPEGHPGALSAPQCASRAPFFGDARGETVEMIRPTFQGRRFRNTLCARWAVFFETLGLPWEYEPEGFYHSEFGAYFPDFLVNYPKQFWFEVARVDELLCYSHSATRNQLERLRDFEGLYPFNRDVLILDGPPDLRMYCTPSNYTAEPKRFGFALWSYKYRVWADDHENFFDNLELYDPEGDLRKAVNTARNFDFRKHGA